MKYLLTILFLFYANTVNTLSSSVASFSNTAQSNKQTGFANIRTSTNKVCLAEAKNKTKKINFQLQTTVFNKLDTSISSLIKKVTINPDKLEQKITKLEIPTIITPLILAYQRPELNEIQTIEKSFNILPVTRNGYDSANPYLLSRNKALSRNMAKIPKDKLSASQPDFWATLYSVESKQGARLYRPRNKSMHCATTPAPCGHFQLSLQALKDIGCSTTQCMKDRENYAKSLAMSQKLQAINQKRLEKKGFTRKLPDYQRYLIHQQGAFGLKRIIAAKEGKGVLSKTVFKNMANNSSYSVKKLKNMGSKLAAKTFLQYWKKKWDNEKELIVVSRQALKDLPLLTDSELQIALNLKIRF